MGFITDARAQLKTDLVTAGLNVVDFIPARITPPVILINAGSPYLEPKSLANQYTLNLELVLVSQNATNEMATQNLDELIEEVLNAIPAYAVITNGVGQPYGLGTNNADYLSANIPLNLIITI
jgi:hypothetical protein